MKIFKEKIKHKSRLLTDKLLLLLLKGWIKRKFYVRYINLDERKDRKKHIETLLGRFNVNYKRINATKFKSINGATEEEITIFKRGVESYLISEEFHKNRFNGVIGCYMSHIRAIKDINTNDNKLQLIFEDDIQITSIRFFLSIKSKIKHLPRNWDICLIDCQGDYIKNDKIKSFLYMPKGTYPDYNGAYAVLINQKRKNHILKAFEENPIRDYDSLLTWNTTAINTYIIITNYIRQQGMFTSDITMK